MNSKTRLVTTLLLLVTVFSGYAQPGIKVELISPTLSEMVNFPCIPKAYRYGKGWSLFAPGTFNATTFVYNSTAKDALVIDTLPFRTPVNILADYPGHFLICSPEGKQGFVKTTDLYLHEVFWGLKSCTYLLGITEYGTDDPMQCGRSKLRVMKVNRHDSILDVYTDSIRGKFYSVELIYNNALKKSEAVLRISYDCYSGQGVDVNHFLIDNGKIGRLTLQTNTGDGGSADISRAYLPVRLDNSKKVVLAQDGVLSVNRETAEVKLYPYPSTTDVPIDELVVVERYSTETMEDEHSGRLQLDADGRAKQNIFDKSITFYRWDGNRLVKVE
jgi:hypothetical protein